MAPGPSAQYCAKVRCSVYVVCRLHLLNARLVAGAEAVPLPSISAAVDVLILEVETETARDRILSDEDLLAVQPDTDPVGPVEVGEIVRQRDRAALGDPEPISMVLRRRIAGEPLQLSRDRESVAAILESYVVGERASRAANDKPGRSVAVCLVPS